MALLRETLRPDALPAGRVAACVGLIADTHLPDRCLALPPAVFDVFRGVEMIVHAGDVGARSVLDELGAVAPVAAVRGLVSRQRHQTVALLYLRDDGVPCAVHVDLARPDRPFSVAVEWGAGFRAARARYDEPLLAPGMVAAGRRLRALAPLLGPSAAAALRPALHEAALRCWTGEQERITGADIVDALSRRPDVRPPARRAVAAALACQRGAAWGWTVLALADAVAERRIGRRVGGGAREAAARAGDVRA